MIRFVHKGSLEPIFFLQPALMKLHATRILRDKVSTVSCSEFIIENVLLIYFCIYQIFYIILFLFSIP